MDHLARSLRARQRVLAAFNKRQSDFASLREWNDYLERVETLIFNLTEGVDVNATEAAIAEHKRANASEIAHFAARARETKRGRRRRRARVGARRHGDGRDRALRLPRTAPRRSALLDSSPAPQTLAFARETRAGTIARSTARAPRVRSETGRGERRHSVGPAVPTSRYARGSRGDE